MTRNYRTKQYLTLIFTFFITISLTIFVPSVALADLPPRPGPSAPSSDPGSDADAGDPIGGYITLQAPMAPAGIWTVVQWQDQAGGWHDIEGWRGLLDDDRQKVWWIAPADFGKGPFRWVVYQGQNGKSLTSSSPFYLPSAAYETVSVEIGSLPGQSLPSPDKLPVSQQGSAEVATSSTSTSTPDFLPVTGGEPEIISVSKLALTWGMLLALINRALTGLKVPR